MGREHPLELGPAEPVGGAGPAEGGGEFTGRRRPEIGRAPAERPEGEGEGVVPGEGPWGGGP